MDNPFKLVSVYEPTGDQPQAIKELVQGLNEGKPLQVLLGATGTGKTFTMANIINTIQRPTLIIVHNKVLASQLYNEFKELFPNNRVEYFVSNFDYYRPEAYLPKSDLHIEKSAVMNEEIEMLRASAINSIIERRDTIIIASVASIYGLSDPDEYRNLVFNLRVGESIDRKKFYSRLVFSQYQRKQYELVAGSFRGRGDVVQIMPPMTDDYYIQVELFDDVIEKISQVDYETKEVLHTYQSFPIFPAHTYATTLEKVRRACRGILEEMVDRRDYFHNNNKFIEEQRVEMIVKQDVDSLYEYGMCPGIENYSRHIDGRKEGERPFCLVDYFPKDFLLIVDESHATFPQIRGMYAGDHSRKLNLVDYGFRLPSALDNRPLMFSEFEEIMPQTICTTATPGDYELEKCDGEVVEQIIRPTGLLDPVVEIRPSLGQLDDLTEEILERVSKKERVMVVTLTIKSAEELTKTLHFRGIKVVYMHTETKTLDRTKIIYELRKGTYDVLVGINLLREGLDIPEVSLITILDADMEGFLRSYRSLIQIIGRAARNSNGKVIMYADRITASMDRAINETKRRRSIQEEYNTLHNITPKTIVKPIAPPLQNIDADLSMGLLNNDESVLPRGKINQIKKFLTAELSKAVKKRNFERANEIQELIDSFE